MVGVIHMNVNLIHCVHPTTISRREIISAAEGEHQMLGLCFLVHGFISN